ncbi:YqaA family protein [Thiomicrorhabdus lithotrophica]|uniref:DedA family protein n=1 Tax=Thiomicrorhabdus lithotrophica TaxID=2949997 RepID=A0ABY8CDR1_9GAMM|nr:YqaA family protein [Thiomicrorhabdus lithotrophica]WEJ62656.1 DedA family protein [Thiomicrorhabdus lithotrophica]
MEYFLELGYVGLFLSAFLAATILPLGSEVVLVGLLLNGFNPVSVVSVATVGNVLGSLVNYAIGFFGSAFVIHSVLKISDESFDKSKQRFEKWGTASLLLAWVPIIGDPLTVIAGVLRINIWLFLLLVTVGKLARYVVVSYTTLNI